MRSNSVGPLSICFASIGGIKTTAPNNTDSRGADRLRAVELARELSTADRRWDAAAKRAEQWTFEKSHPFGGEPAQN